jgi:hypothetical protein
MPQMSRSALLIHSCQPTMISAVDSAGNVNVTTSRSVTETS